MTRRLNATRAQDILPDKRAASERNRAERCTWSSWGPHTRTRAAGCVGGYYSSSFALPLFKHEPAAVLRDRAINEGLLAKQTDSDKQIGDRWTGEEGTRERERGRPSKEEERHDQLSLVNAGLHPLLSSFPLLLVSGPSYDASPHPSLLFPVLSLAHLLSSPTCYSLHVPFFVSSLSLFSFSSFFPNPFPLLSFYFSLLLPFYIFPFVFLLSLLIVSLFFLLFHPHLYITRWILFVFDGSSLRILDKTFSIIKGMVHLNKASKKEKHSSICQQWEAAPLNTPSD